MDGSLVKIVLRAIAEDNPSAIQSGESEAAVAWLKQRIRARRNDKGGEMVYFAEIDAAARAAHEAVRLFRRGDVEAAKPFALEALKHLGG